MNKNIELISTVNMDRNDWLNYRKTGVGASEVGCIMGLSPYKSNIELFYEKIGEGIGRNIENIFMFMGKQSEDKIAELWQYWEGSEQSIIDNFYAGKVVRRCQRVNAYVRNPKFPWLFVSLDRKINKTESKGEGALEIKTLSSYESDKWEGGIPPSHLVQVQTQIGVCEFEFGELAVQKDGRRFEVYEFDFKPELFESIVESTHDFWQRVEMARAIATKKFEAQANFNIRAVQELEARLHELEPAPDGSDAYNDFMKRKYNLVSPGEISGTLVELEHALSHKAKKAEIKKIEEEVQLHENTLKRFMGEKDFLNLGEGNGFVSWKANVKGSRIFLNKSKAKGGE